MLAIFGFIGLCRVFVFHTWLNSLPLLCFRDVFLLLLDLGKREHFFRALIFCLLPMFLGYGCLLWLCFYRPCPCYCFVLCSDSLPLPFCFTFVVVKWHNRPTIVLSFRMSPFWSAETIAIFQGGFQYSAIELFRDFSRDRCFALTS